MIPMGKLRAQGTVELERIEQRYTPRSISGNFMTLSLQGYHFT